MKGEPDQRLVGESVDVLQLRRAVRWFKQSGIGREMGTLGFEEYTEVKVISEGLVP